MDPQRNYLKTWATTGTSLLTFITDSETLDSPLASWHYSDFDTTIAIVK